jgi:hypothetical protein
VSLKLAFQLSGGDFVVGLICLLVRHHTRWRVSAAQSADNAQRQGQTGLIKVNYRLLRGYIKLRCLHLGWEYLGGLGRCADFILPAGGFHVYHTLLGRSADIRRDAPPHTHLEDI